MAQTPYGLNPTDIAFLNLRIRMDRGENDIPSAFNVRVMVLELSPCGCRSQRGRRDGKVAERGSRSSGRATRREGSEFVGSKAADRRELQLLCIFRLEEGHRAPQSSWRSNESTGGHRVCCEQGVRSPADALTMRTLSG